MRARARCANSGQRSAVSAQCSAVSGQLILFKSCPIAWPTANGTSSSTICST
ncbi:MAG: hypothetical protein F6J98_13010 [Moorea sp. SIO4G2]|uniref:hypothetical protein n=1 Tax=Moorena bouillonii TaxID=207920 RepID=UPI0013012D50|nr:hypothetical protein [Moorena bouillonii]NEO46909.1 hypothetical protein [Moorena sp. SIO4A3]NEO61300.1 hypothetical protein [Moorena sp. SIO4G2]